MVAKRTVFDSKAAGERVIDQIFSFTEPAGSYSISGPTPQEEAVHIQAGTTSTVALTAACSK